jgi:hypothetical protein
MKSWQCPLIQGSRLPRIRLRLAGEIANSTTDKSGAGGQRVVIFRGSGNPSETYPGAPLLSDAARTGVDSS